MVNIRGLAVVLTLLSSAGAAAGATLDVVGGMLAGASGVNVGGTLYDVAFVDGTCIAVYNGCDSVADFAFTTLADTQAANQALLDQVFIDGPAGNFDSSPELTIGCEDLNYCQSVTPFSISGSTMDVNSALNRNPGFGPDIVQSGFSSTSNSTDYSGNSVLVFAVWTPAPEPSTGVLLTAGLVLMARKRRAVAR